MLGLQEEGVAEEEGSDDFLSYKAASVVFKQAIKAVPSEQLVGSWWAGVSSCVAMQRMWSSGCPSSQCTDSSLGLSLSRRKCMRGMWLGRCVVRGNGYVIRVCGGTIIVVKDN